MSPALAGGFLTTGPPEKPNFTVLKESFQHRIPYSSKLSIKFKRKNFQTYKISKKLTTHIYFRRKLVEDIVQQIWGHELREENIETRKYGKEYFHESDKGKFYNSNCEPELKNILQSGSRESRKKSMGDKRKGRSFNVFGSYRNYF